jgi:hypothetical protein
MLAAPIVTVARAVAGSCSSSVIVPATSEKRPVTVSFLTKKRRLRIENSMPDAGLDDLGRR